MYWNGRSLAFSGLESDLQWKASGVWQPPRRPRATVPLALAECDALKECARTRTRCLYTQAKLSQLNDFLSVAVPEANRCWMMDSDGTTASSGNCLPDLAYTPGQRLMSISPGSCDRRMAAGSDGHAYLRRNISKGHLSQEHLPPEGAVRFAEAYAKA